MRYFVSRLGFLLLSVWAAVTLNFALPRLMPGNPALIMITKFQGRMPPQALHALELQFGFSNKPVILQYFQYLWSMVNGHFGVSFLYYPVPVSSIISSALPWTLGLLGIVWLLSVTAGTLTGIWIAWRRGGFLDTTLPVLTMFFQSIPGFWLAIVLVYFLAYQGNTFPMDHAYDVNLKVGLNGTFIASVLYHAVLPGVVVFIGSLSGWIVGMRNNMINVLGEDYVVFAEAKGVSPRRLIFSYAARNAMLPQITSIAIALSTIIGGQILIEQVFSYPGIGYALTSAVSAEDYPLVQGMFLIIAIATLVINFIIDMIYGRLDPRVRRRGATA